MFNGRRPIVLLDVVTRLIQLPMCVLLKHFLERDFGCRVILTSPHYPGRTLEDLIPFMRPDLIIPSKASQLEGVRRTIHEHRHLFQRLPRLGFLLGDPPAYGPVETCFRQILLGHEIDWSDVSFYLCTNDFLRRDILASGKLPADRVHSVGCARFDFYASPLNSLITSRERLLTKYGLDPDKLTITIATTPQNIPRDQLTKGFFAGHHEWVEYGQGDRISWDALMKDTVAVRSTMLAQAAALARARPAWQIIVKPHPTDDAAFIAEEVGSWQLPNVKVVVDEYIWDLLNAADLHIHRYCTTGFEAWFLDKPTIDFRPTEFTRRAYPDYSAGHVRCENPAELLDLAEQLVRSSSWREQLGNQRRAVIDAWFQADGQSTWRHAAIIGEAARAESQHTESPLRRRAHRLRVEWHEARCAIRLAWTHRGSAGDFDHKGRTWLWFTPAEERKWARDIARVIRQQRPRTRGAT